MCCRVCGNEEAFYRPKKRQRLCHYCAKETPYKVGFREFCEACFPGGDCESYAGDPGRNVAKEVYSDYLTSELKLSGYVLATTGPA